MKRKSFLFTAGLILATMAFSACDKSSDSETVGPTIASKKLSKVIFQTDDGGGIEENFTWDGDFLSKVQVFTHVGQTLSSYVVFFNDGKRLIGSEYYQADGGDVERTSSTEYTYDGNNIVRVKKTKYVYEYDGSFNEDGWELWEMSYSGDKMVSVSHSDNINPDDGGDHYVWSGNNIIGEQEGFELFRYGNMKNPLKFPSGANIEYSADGYSGHGEHQLLWIMSFGMWCENLLEQIRTGQSDWDDIEEYLNWTIITDEDGYPVKYVCDGDYYRGIIILEYEE